MNKIEQLYRAAPVRNSPDALDREILKQAQLQVAGQTTANTAGPLLSSWMPIAASFVVVAIGLSLVLRSGMIGTSSVDLQLDGYPEALTEADAVGRVRDVVSSREDSRPVESIPEESSFEASSGEERRLAGLSDNVQLLQQQPIQSENRLAKNKERAAPQVVQSQHMTDQSSDRLASSTQKRRADLSQQKRQAKQIDLTSADLALAARSSSNAVPQSASSTVESGGVESSAVSMSRESNTLAGSRLEAEELEAVVADSAAPTADQAALAESVGIESSPAEISHKRMVAPDSSSTDALRQQTAPPSVNLNGAIDMDNLQARGNASSGLSMDTSESNSRREAIILVANGALDWLHKQPQSSYTLQLATANDDVYLAELAQRIARDSRQGLQFVVLPLLPANAGDARSFTLLAGAFGTFDDAQNELTQLPDHARKFDARVRNVGVLQKPGK